MMKPLRAREGKKMLRDFNVLLPVDDVQLAQEVLPLAVGLLGNSRNAQVNLIGVTQVPIDASLSEGALFAQALRNDLDQMADETPGIKRLAGSLVSHKPWDDIEAMIDQRMDDQDLLLLAWQSGMKYFQTDLAEVLNDPPCNVVIAHPAVHPQAIKRILLPVRGGPFANLSLQLAVRLARAANAEITLLRVVPNDDDAMSQILREKFAGLSDAFPEITTELQIVGDAGAAILRELKEHQAVILGASGAADGPPIGLVASLILQRKDVTTLIVKTKEPFRLPLAPARQAELPVLVRVEKWFAESTFHSREFADVSKLVDLKRRQGVRISLGLPARNEESTIGNLIQTMKQHLVDDAPLIDEIVLIDRNSTDFTRKIAAELGVIPYIHQEVLPGLGSLRGKGEALWKSLYLLKGDLIVWLDTDIINPHPRMVYGVLGPLLMDPQIQYVKGFYQRPTSADGGSSQVDSGSVTEVLARPMINLFTPELSGLVQPLSGIYGGRRSALEQVPFYTGHGVEMGLLLDLLERFRLKAIAQVDLEEVRHRNQELRELSKMSFAILQVFAQHLRQRGLMDTEMPIERTMKLLRVEEQRFHLEEVDMHEQKRPPMIEVKEYRGRHTSQRG
jgi:nucleotide-binding universal stress UspA family protein